MYESFLIAPDHDNIEGLMRLADYDESGCAFKDWKSYIPYKWHDMESREQAGDRIFVRIGSPWCELEFVVMTELEWSTLVTEFGFSALVTIYAYDRTARRYKFYNATYHLPEEPEFENGEYRDIVIEFRDLQEITP